MATVKRKGSIWDIAQELNDLLRMMKGFEEKDASVLNFQAPGDKTLPKSIYRNNSFSEFNQHQLNQEASTYKAFLEIKPGIRR